MNEKKASPLSNQISIIIVFSRKNAIISVTITKVY